MQYVTAGFFLKTVRLAAHRMVWSNWIMKESNVLQYKYVSHALARRRRATLHGTMCVCNMSATAHVVPLYIPDSLSILYRTNGYRRYEGWYQKIP